MTERVIRHEGAAKLLSMSGIIPSPKEHVLRGITDRLTVFEIPTAI